MHYEIIVNAALEAAILVTQVTSVNDNMIIGDVGGMRKDEERSDVYNDFHLKGGLCAPLGGGVLRRLLLDTRGNPNVIRRHWRRSPPVMDSAKCV